MITLKVTKKQGSILSLEDIFFKKPQEFPTPSSFRVKVTMLTGFRKMAFLMHSRS